MSGGGESSGGFTADYVVVGAGSAGCALAARLSEDPSVRVLLLEAGGRDRNLWLHIPVGYGKTMFHPTLSWNLQTEPEPELEGRRIPWPRGRVLGGSSAINGLIYIRGQKEDYDHWRQLGCTGWSFDDVLPYFKRAEDQERGADALHGVGGPLGVSNLGDQGPLARAFIEAAVELGLPRNDDFNGPTQEGAGFYQVTARKGWRCSAATAYLKPARKRPNLRVETGAQATRLLFEGRRCVGVAFRQNGVLREARAAREVILCGGAIASPQLLLLSGVGPAEELAALGIPVVQDLPQVGRNLQDHFQVRIVYRCRQRVTLNDRMASLRGRAGMALEFALFRRGMMTISAGTAGLFARVLPGSATPDVQYHFIPFSADGPGRSLHPFSGFTISVCQLRPESRGTITLASPDPSVPARIRANYLSTETDRRCIVEGLKLTRRLAATRAMAPFVEAEYLPGPEAEGEDALLAHARRAGTTIFHPSGTCRMGSDLASVVDTELRVRGIAGLRVADASIMPTVVSGNTNAACIMIGEKAADLIRAEARMRPALAA
ncbi:MAG: choline dehydrogenase [Acetobacteraceae bacterium]|nr:choline dehydrogenase [Acetobacteraceae bacterium]